MTSHSPNAPEVAGPGTGRRVPNALVSAFAHARVRWALLLLGAILVLAAVVRMYDIAANPPGFFADEAAYGYNAYTILETGRDDTGARLPVFFRSFGEYKLPVYIYTQVPVIAVFGLSETSVRVTTAIYGVLTVLAVYLLLRVLFRQEGAALAAAAVLAILPWHIHYSRTGLGEIIVFPFLLVFSLYLFHVGTKRPVIWILAAVSCALTFYSYRSAWVTLPPMLLILAVLYRKELLQHWRWAAASIAILAVLSIPIPVHLLSVSTDRAQDQSLLASDAGFWETIRTFLSQYRAHFEASFLFDGTAERNIRHLIPGTGWLYWWQAPLLVIGAAALLWRPTRPKLLLIALFVLFPLGGALSLGSPSSSRSILGSVGFAVITGYGIAAAATILAGWRISQAPRLLGPGLAILMLIGVTGAGSLALASFLDEYHGTYRNVASRYSGWQWGPRQILERFDDVGDQYDQVIMDRQFNGTIVFVHFYNPDGCDRCLIGGWNLYDPEFKQLFALRPTTLWFSLDYDVKEALHYPDGEVAFLFVEINSLAAEMPGILPLQTAALPDAAGRRGDTPSQAMAYAEAGLASLELGDREAAVRDFSRALDRDPSLTEALINRATARWQLGDYLRALRDYNAALELDQSLAISFYNRGTALAIRGVYVRAANDLRRAFELAPAMVAARNNFGNVLLAIGEPERAIAELTQALSLDPSLALAFMNRGRAYIATERYGLALVDLNRAIELQPGLALPYLYRGIASMETGRLDNALADFAAAQRLDPRASAAYAHTAWIHLQRGTFDLAADSSATAIELDRDYAFAYAVSGLARVRSGEVEQGLADLEQAIMLDRIFFTTPLETQAASWELPRTSEVAERVRESMAAITGAEVASALASFLSYLAERPADALSEG